MIGCGAAITVRPLFSVSRAYLRTVGHSRARGMRLAETPAGHSAIATDRPPLSPTNRHRRAKIMLPSPSSSSTMAHLRHARVHDCDLCVQESPSRDRTRARYGTRSIRTTIRIVRLSTSAPIKSSL